MSKIFQIFTDGSCIGNPGPGGYGVIVKSDDEYLELSGGESPSTNNRMEMTAVLEAFKHLNKLKVTDAKIEVFSDSLLVLNTFKLGWKKKENKDLWAIIEAEYAGLLSRHNKFEWHWVKGHSGHKENERCDELARAVAESL